MRRSAAWASTWSDRGARRKALDASIVYVFVFVRGFETSCAQCNADSSFKNTHKERTTHGVAGSINGQYATHIAASEDGGPAGERLRTAVCYDPSHINPPPPSPSPQTTQPVCESTSLQVSEHHQRACHSQPGKLVVLAHLGGLIIVLIHQVLVVVRLGHLRHGLPEELPRTRHVQ